MKYLVECLSLSAFFLASPFVFAQNSDGPASDSGVLVSPPIKAQGADQDNTANNGGRNLSDSSNQSNSNSPSHHRHHQADGDSGSSLASDTGNNSDSVITSNASLAGQ